MKPSLAISYALKKRAKKMAEGGDVVSPTLPVDPDEYKKRMASIIKMGKDTPQDMMAEGGHIDDQCSDEMDHEDDMVSRIMKKRAGYSEGGMIANGGEDDLDEMADGKPNEFDDVALRDDLESSYTGANSGDELGNEQEADDRHDIIARIMASRRKKDRMPSPA